MINKIINTCLSVFRMLLLTRFFTKTPKIRRHSERCIVLGNGPSLPKLLAENLDRLADYDLIAINHYGVSPEYALYKPSVYILCDPAFWYAVESERFIEKTTQLYDAIVKVTDWDMQLYLPHLAKKRPDVIQHLAQNKHIDVRFFNKTKVEGFDPFSRFAYDKQWGMPRAQNIVIASLMLLIYSQYKDIYLFGTENDSFRYLWVDEDNRVRYSYQHFYKEPTKHTNDVVSNEKLYQQFESLSFAFKSYTQVEAYARHCGVNVYNATPNSCIDAFRRMSLPEK